MADTAEKLFTEWFERYKALIFKVVRAYADNLQDQDDLFQEILLQLWSSIPNFNSDCSQTTWIYRVALNTALSWRRGQTRKKKKHKTMLDITEHAYIEQNYSSRTQDHSVLNQVYDAIRQLPKAESSIIIMHLDGLSYDEMAEVLGITISNVGVRLNRARKNLAQLLKGVIDDF